MSQLNIDDNNPSFFINSEYDYNEIGYYANNKIKTYKFDEEIENILNDLESNTNMIFLVDNMNNYVGCAKVSDLLINDSIDKCIKYKYPKLNAKAITEEVLLYCEKYKMSSYPVVDNNKLIGIIDFKTVLELTKEELLDDYYKLAGFTDSKKAKNDGESIGKRIPWLIVSLATMLAISVAMIAFKDIFTSYPVLPIYSVMVLAISQGYAIIEASFVINLIRKKFLHPAKEIHYVYEEIKKGFMASLLIELLAFLVIYFYQIFTKTNYLDQEFYAIDALKFAGGIALSLFAGVFISSFIGVAVPNICNKIGYDISFSSMILLSTLSDIIVLSAFYLITNAIFSI